MNRVLEKPHITQSTNKNVLFFVHCLSFQLFLFVPSFTLTHSDVGELTKSEFIFHFFSFNLFTSLGFITLICVLFFLCLFRRLFCCRRRRCRHTLLQLVFLCQNTKIVTVWMYAVARRTWSSSVSELCVFFFSSLKCLDFSLKHMSENIQRIPFRNVFFIALVCLSTNYFFFFDVIYLLFRSAHLFTGFSQISFYFHLFVRSCDADCFIEFPMTEYK